MGRFNQMRGPEYFMEYLPNRGVSNIAPVALSLSIWKEERHRRKKKDIGCSPFSVNRSNKHDS